MRYYSPRDRSTEVRLLGMKCPKCSHFIKLREPKDFQINDDRNDCPHCHLVKLGSFVLQYE